MLCEEWFSLATHDCIDFNEYVRMKGLEPPLLTEPDPKSGAATNYATCAKAVQS